MIIKYKEKKMMFSKKLNGFSLLELLVVLSIIGIILSFVIPNVIDRPDAARQAKIINDINVINAALDLYRLDNGDYPDENKGLKILFDKNKRYLNGIPKDPWDIPYRYRNPGKFMSIDIFSYGADNSVGGENENKDIGNWSLEIKQ